MQITYTPGGVEQVYGGISRYVFELVSRMNARGHDAKVSSPLFWNGYFASANQTYISGKRVPSPGFGTGQFVKYMNRNYWAMGSHAKSANLVHHTYYFDREWPQSCRPRVLTVYDMIHENFPEQFPDARKVSIAKRRACSDADLVIAISESTKSDLLRFFDLDPSHVTVVHLAGSLDKQQESEQAFQRPFLLYVGSRSGYKNFSSLIGALRDVDEFVEGDLGLTVFGGGPPTEREIAIINAAGLPTNNIVWRSGNDQVLAGLYQHATALVYPSVYEGFGIPPLEAMSLGCPVIAGNNSSIPEVVGNSAVLINTEDLGELTNSIQRLVRDQSFRADYIRRGTEQSKKFSWDRVVDETLAVYERLL